MSAAQTDNAPVRRHRATLVVVQLRSGLLAPLECKAGGAQRKTTWHHPQPSWSWCHQRAGCTTIAGCATADIRASAHVSACIEQMRRSSCGAAQESGPEGGGRAALGGVALMPAAARSGHMCTSS